MALKTYQEFYDEYVALAIGTAQSRMPGVDVGHGSMMRIIIESGATAHAHAMAQLQAKFWASLEMDDEEVVSRNTDPKPTGIRTRQPKRFKR